MWTLVPTLVAFLVVASLSVGLGVGLWVRPPVAARGVQGKPSDYYVSKITGPRENDEHLDESRNGDAWAQRRGGQAILYRTSGTSIWASTSFECENLTATAAYEDILFVGDAMGNLFIVRGDAVTVLRPPGQNQPVLRVVAPDGIPWIQYPSMIAIRDTVVTDADSTRVSLGLVDGRPVIHDRGLVYHYALRTE